MVFKKLPYLLLSLFVLLSCTSENTDAIPNYWAGSLQLSDEVTLPIIFEIKLEKGDSSFKLINGAEKLVFDLEKENGNNYSVRLEPYNSELRFSLLDSKIQGVWNNLAKGKDYKINFTAGPSIKDTLVKLEAPILKFQVQFGQGNDAYPAILLLKKENNKLSGTIKTETGDYRYLWGEQKGDAIWLACFDGAHAFLFTAKQKEDSLTLGVFFSGNHYIDTWKAQLNANYELTDPTKLTKSTSDSLFRFSLIDQNGFSIDQSNKMFDNRFVCIQIMGTWCPNCKDETDFLKEMRAKYPKNELQIIAAAFEYEKDTAKALNRIKRYSKAMDMNYSIYYGGSTNKKKVIDVFPDLDRVISYPTMILLDKDGKVLQVHTGFNGPATDEYANFVESMNHLIDSLIIE